MLKFNLPSALLAEWAGFFFYVPHRGGTHIKESAQKVNSGEENSPPVPAVIQINNLSIMTLVLYQQAIPAIPEFLVGS